jgi:surface antigen
MECVAALALAVLVAPARGLASETSFTPSAASLVQTPRTCPSPTVAAYYDTTCWTVKPDLSSPFYSPDGPYPWGQCTYWALEMRPDLWNNRSATDPDAGDWTAYTWPQHAALEGLTVDHAPADGAVIVWPQTADNDTGHVAYVQSVSVDRVTGDDLVTVQEMNDTTFDDPSQGQGDTMTMSMDSSDLAQVQIIHVPGSSTGTVPTAPAPTTTTPPSATTTPTATTKTRTSARATATSTRSSSTARRSPKLSIILGRHGALSITTRSPATVRATIVRLPSDRVVDRSDLRSGATITLPAGHLRLCVAQVAVAGWSGARACVAR